MNSDNQLAVCFWRYEDSSSGYHIYIDDKTVSDAINIIDALASKPIGASLEFAILPPEQAVLAGADSNNERCIFAKRLLIRSAEPGVWTIQESADEVHLLIGLPWVQIFGRMLDIGGVSFGPTDESSKVHIWR